MTTQKIATVEIHNDDEGFFAGMPTDELETVDVENTLAKYALELSQALREDMPEIDFSLLHGPYGGRSIRVTSDLSEQEEQDISESVGEVVARVYESGTFWTVKA
jgi:hypothetical protein